jgi:hypothetical protein
MVFGFLSKHGRRLDADATYTVPGDLVGALGAQRSQRQFQALERALLAGDLEIVKSPAVYLLDRDGVGTQVLAKDDRELGTQEPSTEGGNDFRPADYNDD